MDVIDSEGDIVATARMVNNVFKLDLVQSQCWLAKRNCVNELVLDFENTDDTNDCEMVGEKQSSSGNGLYKTESLGDIMNVEGESTDSSESWRKGMNVNTNEFNSLLENNFLESTELPPKRKANCVKWVGNTNCGRKPQDGVHCYLTTVLSMD